MYMYDIDALCECTIGDADFYMKVQNVKLSKEIQYETKHYFFFSRCHCNGMRYGLVLVSRS